MVKVGWLADDLSIVGGAEISDAIFPDSSTPKSDSDSAIVPKLYDFPEPLFPLTKITCDLATSIKIGFDSDV